MVQIELSGDELRKIGQTLMGAVGDNVPVTVTVADETMTVSPARGRREVVPVEIPTIRVEDAKNIRWNTLWMTVDHLNQRRTLHRDRSEAVAAAGGLLLRKQHQTTCGVMALYRVDSHFECAEFRALMKEVQTLMLRAAESDDLPISYQSERARLEVRPVEIADIVEINTDEEFRDLVVKLGLSNCHEPDKRGLGMTVLGDHLDTAFGASVRSSEYVAVLRDGDGSMYSVSIGGLIERAAASVYRQDED